MAYYKRKSVLQILATLLCLAIFPYLNAQELLNSRGGRSALESVTGRRLQIACPVVRDRGAEIWCRSRQEA